jgi:RNA polymerase sigma factor (TIGR02999 family)
VNHASIDTSDPVTEQGDLTQLLVRWQGGDQAARDQLTAAIYQHLKNIARRRLSEQARYIVDPTELVNEVLIKLIQSPSAAEDREQLFKIAASAVRYTLLDLVRRRDAEKRGHGETTSLDNIGMTFVEDQARLTIDEWIDAEQALVELERLDPRKCRIAELAFIIGLEQVEISDVMRLSLSTVERELRFCRSWLRARLNPPTPQPDRSA